MKILKYAGFCLLSCALPFAAMGAGMNVQEIQIKPDGQTDNTAALQAALDGGKTDLYFPAGEYRLGAVTLPAETHLVFSPRARIKPMLEKIAFTKQVEPKGIVRKVRAKKPLFTVAGDRVRLEGLHFDFAASGTEKDPAPIETLVYAEGVSDPVVSGFSVETSSKPEGALWDPKARDLKILFYAYRCRNVVLENCGATQISHMLSTTECTNVTSRGNWMIGGGTITTFAGGSENLRHHDNWSRGVDYQIVWRGGSPDPSRKAPRVPLGTAAVVKRGVKPDSPDWVDHTQGIFDVMVENNYAEYGTTLCWGNKGRQTIVNGNIARFMFDYSFGTEGGENLIFSNNISVNSSVAGICALYWGEKLLVTGNLILVRHEPFDPKLTGHPESLYFGQFIRLHHGPPNPEDKYGDGGVSITGNLFVNELSSRPSGISIEAGRDIMLSGNKIINGLVRKYEELRQVPDGKPKDSDEFASQTSGKEVGEGVKVERLIGLDVSRVTILGNEFISRQDIERSCLLIEGSTSSAVVKDNVFRKEAPIITFSEKEKELEKGPPRFMLYSKDSFTDKDLTNSSPTVAVGLAPTNPNISIVQGNVVCGWRDALSLNNASPGKATFVVASNTTDGTVKVDGPADRTVKKIESNIQLPAN